MLLDQILLHAPCPIFWKDTKGAFLGCNKSFLSISKFDDYNQLIGKTDAELPWKDYKDEYCIDDQYVITTGETITRIENIPLNGRIITSETTKTPLIQDGKIIGVLGICLDITDRQEKERLKLENQLHLLREQDNFRKIVGQMAHDIGSPLMALNVLANSCLNIPEGERIMLIEAISKINDIANSLLREYQIKESDMTTESELSDLLVSTTLEQLIMDKKYEYQNLPIKFKYICNPGSHFCFIQANATAFKRMISNLLNNAIDALEGNWGKFL